eukprot:UN30402
MATRGILLEAQTNDLVRPEERDMAVWLTQSFVTTRDLPDTATTAIPHAHTVGAGRLDDVHSEDKKRSLDATRSEYSDLVSSPRKNATLSDSESKPKTKPNRSQSAWSPLTRTPGGSRLKRAPILSPKVSINTSMRHENAPPSAKVILTLETQENVKAILKRINFWDFNIFDLYDICGEHTVAL